MILSAQRLRSIGWLALLAVCGALVMILSFRVNALRSQVHRAEGQIVALKQQKMYLETEFETRANQQQLKAWNDLEFGYVAPVAGQYLENERQLAVLSKPAEPDAPAPIRVATVDDSVIAAAAFPALSGSNAAVRPLSETHEAEHADDDGGAGKPRSRALDHAAATATLAEKLGTLHAAGARQADAADEKREKHGKPIAKRTATVDKAKSTASREGGAQTKAVGKSARSDSKSAAKSGREAKPAVKTAQKTIHGDRKTGVKTSR
ncbi:hypothetical protein [Novosphingobium pokkalii]|uniref:Cell division protein FtsL n=1 Tax=Novosphingobium pokkalii TaxID=1770194 RepID=A0ABV7V7Q5_9SPHN|nr:hypothetical protein [Novosphingobium pokkalii]GHC88298.1 hypothetical protein GCM10019060_10940 [Novosphingobium pokkalii]